MNCIVAFGLSVLVCGISWVLKCWGLSGMVVGGSAPPRLIQGGHGLPGCRAPGVNKICAPRGAYAGTGTSQDIVGHRGEVERVGGMGGCSHTLRHALRLMVAFPAFPAWPAMRGYPAPRAAPRSMPLACAGDNGVGRVRKGGVVFFWIFY